jgi:hypothetical protein
MTPMDFSDRNCGHSALAETTSFRQTMGETTMQNGSISLARLNLEEQESFRRIYIASFPLFLVAALIARLAAPWQHSLAYGPRIRRSIFGEAKALANTAIPFAFMK